MISQRHHINKVFLYRANNCLYQIESEDTREDGSQDTREDESENTSEDESENTRENVGLNVDFL